MYWAVVIPEPSVFVNFGGGRGIRETDHWHGEKTKERINRNAMNHLYFEAIRNKWEVWQDAICSKPQRQADRDSQHRTISHSSLVWHGSCWRPPFTARSFV